MHSKLTPFLMLLSLTACATSMEKQNGAPQIIAKTEVTKNLNGNPIRVPQEPKVVATVVRVMPGESLPPHKHPYPRYAYMLKGEFEVTLEDENRVIHAKPGDFVAETINGWHHGINKGTEPVEILVIDQVPQSTKTNMIFREKRP